jgi:hypothetical protein
MQNDATLENLHAMTDAAREYGVYRSPSSPSAKTPVAPFDGPAPAMPSWVTGAKSHPGVCFPWQLKAPELPHVVGDAELVRRVWDDLEGLAYLYIWHVLLSF